MDGDELTSAVGMPTQAAGELAWSDDDVETEQQLSRASWRSAWGYAAVLLSCGVVVAVVAGIVAWLFLAPGDPQPLPPQASQQPSLTQAPPPAPAPAPSVTAEPTPPMATPTPTAVPPAPQPIYAPPTPSNAPHKKTPAELYIWMLKAGGITLDDPSLADADGRNGCAYIAQHGRQALVDNITGARTADGTLEDRQHAETVVSALVTAYCPQYSGNTGNN